MAINKISSDIVKQSGFFNKYPYTDFHELNADFLLTTYRGIVDTVNQIIEWANNHQIDYEEAIERLTAVENEIATFEDDVRNAFAELEAEYDRKFAEQQAALEEALTETREEVARELNRLREEVAQAIANFENQFLELKAQILNELAQTKADVERTIMELRSILEANNAFIFQYVENRLDQFINDFPSIITVYVYNPYRGEVTDIQQAILDIYTVAAIWGLTAEQYDSLGLTASEYDALGLTAQEYDTMGYKLLYKDPNYYMLSPFTGEYVHVKDVIMDLAHLHMGGVTAEVYDLKELTAETYDNLELTAFQYDWYADQLLPA